MATKKYSLEQWINQQLDQQDNSLFAEKHLMNRFVDTGKTEEQKKAYEAYIGAGHAHAEGGHGIDLLTAVKDYRNAMRHWGYTEATVVESGEGTYNIIFSRPNEQADSSKCPVLPIGETDDFGVTTSNHLSAINALTWIRHDNGQVGLASSAAVGIENAAQQLLKIANSRGFNPNDKNTTARARRVTTSAISAVTHKNPMASSRNQKKTFAETFSMDSVQEVRPESIKLMSGQTINSFYYTSLLNAVEESIKQNKRQDFGMDEARIYRQLGEIEQHAKYYTDTESLGKYIKSKFPVIYNNLWKGELENYYNALYSIGLTHGPKSEGATGTFSLFNPQIPGQSLTALSSRKPAQNLRILQKGYKEGYTKGFAPNMTSIKGQFKEEHFSTGDILQQARKNLYVTGELTDANVTEATLEYMKELISKATNATGDEVKDKVLLLSNQLKDDQGKTIDGSFLTDALKGLMSDGSLYAHQIYEDFKIDYEEIKKSRRPELEDKIKELARLKLTEDEYAAFEALASPEERLKALQTGKINDKVIHGRGKKQIDTKKLLHTAFKKVLELGSDAHVQDIFFDPDKQQYIAKVLTQLRTTNNTVRGGATTDDRSVAAMVNDQILARAFIKAGYAPEDVWVDKTDHSKGLKMTHARAARGFSSKTAASDFMGMYQYIYANLFNQGKSNKEIADIFDNSVFKGLVTTEGENHGGVFWNENKLKELMKNNGVSWLIRNMAEFGADLGIYRRNKNGKLFEETTDGSLKLAEGVKLPTAEELGVSSVYRYQGVNDEGSARMRFGEYELHSLEETVGKMRTEGYYEAAESLNGMVSELRGKLAKQQQEFNPYIRNAKFLAGKRGNSFKEEKNEAIRHFKENKGLVLTLDDFEGISDIGDYSDQVAGALEGSAEELYGGIIEIKRQEYYKTLLDEQIEHIRKNMAASGVDFSKFTEKELAIQEEEIKQRAQKVLQEQYEIGSYKDVQIGLDWGENRYIDGKNSIGGFTIFGKGKILDVDENGNRIRKKDADGNDITFLDEIAQLNASIVRIAKRFSLSQGTKYDAIKAGRGVAEATSKILSAISYGGSIWNEYNTLTEDNSGYVLLQSMSTKAQDFLKELGQNFEVNIDGTTYNNTPTNIMNTDDYISIVSKSLKQARKEAKKTGDTSKSDKALEEIKTLYKELYQKEAPEKITDKELIKSVAYALDIDNLGKGFKGAADARFSLWRSPTLKFVDDIIQGGTILSRKLVNRGNIMLDPALASSIKADFDGDRIAIFQAALKGDYNTVQKILPKYYHKLRAGQQLKILKDIADVESQSKQKSEENPKELDSLLDDNLQRIKEAGIHNGKKFAGIYGDLNYGLSQALAHYGIDYTSIISTKPDNPNLPPELQGQQSEQMFPAIAGQLAQAIPGALYQEGINAKNIDVSELDKIGMTVMEAQDKLADMMTSGETWNDVDKLVEAIKFAQKLNYLESDEKGVFKKNVLGNLGLSDTTALPEIQKQYYKIMMEKAITYLKSKNTPDSKEDLDKVETQLDNLKNNRQFILTSQILGQIISDGDKGLKGFLKRKGVDIDDIIRYRYTYMPGRKINPKDYLGIENTSVDKPIYDETSYKKALEYGLISEEDAKNVIITPNGDNSSFSSWRNPKGVTGFHSRYKILSQKGDNLENIKGLNVIRDENGDLTHVLSTTGLVHKIVGGYMGWDPENNDLNDALESIDNLIVNPDSEKDKNFWSLIKGESADSKSIRSVVNGTLIGNLAHRAAEVTANLYIKNNNITKDEIDQYLEKDTEYQQDLKRLGKLYELQYGIDTVRVKKETEANEKRAGGQVQLLLKQLREQNARIIGAETGMIGVVGHDNGNSGESGGNNKSLNLLSGIADLIYETGSAENGDHTIHFVDYKNYASGKPGADVVGQLAIYADMFKTLQEDLVRINAGGDTVSSREYLQRDTALSQMWKELLDDKIAGKGREAREEQWRQEYNEQDEGYKADKTEEDHIAQRRQEYIDNAYEVFDRLFEAASDSGAAVKLHTNITSPNGIVSSYGMQFNTRKDAALINRFLGGQGFDSLNDFEKEQIINRLNHGQSLLYDDTSQIGQAMHFGIEGFDTLTKYFDDIEKLKDRIKIAQDNGDVETEANLAKQLEAELDDFVNEKGKGKGSEARRQFLAAWESLGKSEESRQNQEDFLSFLGLSDFEVEKYGKDPDILLSRIQGNSINKYWDSKATDSRGNKWLKVQKEIRQYEDAIFEAESELNTIEDINNDRYKELIKTLDDLKTVHDALIRQSTDIEQAWFQRNKYGEIEMAGGAPLHKRGFSVFKSKNEINTQIEKKDIEDKKLQEYKQLQLQRSSLISQKDFLQGQLNDSNLKLSETERIAIKTQIQEIDKQLIEHICRRINTIKEEFKKEDAKGNIYYTHSEIQQFDQIAEEEINKSKGTLNSRLRNKEISEEQRLYNEALKNYNALYSAQDALSEHNKRIKETNDPTRKRLLEKEKERLIAQRDLAQNTVFGMEAENNAGSDKTHTAYVSNIYNKAKEEANLTAKLKTQSTERIEALKPVGFVSKIENSVSGLLQSMTSGYGLYKAFQLVTQAIKSLISETKQLDKVITNLRIVTGETKSETRNLVSQYSTLAQQLGATTTEVANSAVEWLRQGYSTAEAMDLVTSSMYLSTLGMIDSTTATKDLTSALKGFKLEAAESMEVVDKLTALDLQAATSAGDIAEGLAQFANLGSLAGVNIDEAAAYVATISDVTQMTGSSAGQALKTIISRYGNVKAGAYNKLNVSSDGVDDSTAVNDVETVLKNLGISIRNSTLQFRDFDDVLNEIAQKWDSLDTVSQKAVATSFAGVRQQEAFVTLMQNWDKYEDLLKVSQNSEGTANKKYQSYREGLEASQNSLVATWQGVVNSAEVSDILKKLLDCLTEIVKYTPTFIKWLSQAFFAIQNLRAFAGNSLIQKGITKKGLTDDKIINYFSTLFSNDKGEHSFKSGIKNIGKKAWVHIAGPTQKDSTLQIINNKKKSRTSQTPQTYYFLGNNEGNSSLISETKSAGSQETLEKEKQLASTKQETLEKEKQLASTKQETLEKEKQLTAETNQTTQDDLQLTAETNQTLQDGYQLNLEALQTSQESMQSTITQTSNIGAAAGAAAGIAANYGAGAAANGAVSGAGGMSALGIGGLVASLVINSVGSMLTTYMSSGTTHSRINSKGEEVSVESSEEAKQAGKEVATMLAAIPFFGTMIDQVFGISDKIMQQIDAERDHATALSEQAEDIISILNSVSSDISDIVSITGSIAVEDLKEREDLVQSIIDTLYTSDGSDTRKLLEEQIQKFYGDSSVTLYSVLKNILSSNSEVSEKATRALDYAQAILEVNQQQLAKSSDDYSEREEFTDEVESRLKIIISQIYGVDTSGHSLSGVEKLVSSPSTLKELLEQERTKYTEILSNDDLSESDRSKYETILEQLVELLNSTDQYISYVQSNIDTYNSNYAAAQLKAAKTEDGDYLVDLNIAEAQALGSSTIYDLIAQSIGAHGLKGIDTYIYRDENGKIITGKSDEELAQMEEEGTATKELTEGFKDIVKKTIQDDPELWAAVSGSSYTLEGALAKLDPNDWADREILQNFADVLGTTVEGLSQYVDKFGQIKYSELIKSTSDLIEEQQGYLDLMSDITDSTKSATEWMNTIINTYPELIGYMSDTPALMEQIMTKIKQLANYEIQTQWSAIADSRAAFRSDDPTANTLVKNMLDSAGDNRDKLESIIDESGETTFNGLINYLKGLDENSEEYKLLYEAISKAGSSYTLTSDVYKSALQNYITYNSTLLENQINNLTAQKEALQDINSQREYENKLIEAKLALENALNDKKRVYRAGVGFVYEADQGAITEAQENLEEVQVEKSVSAIQKQIDLLQQQKDEWDNIWDQKNFELLEEESRAFEQEFLKQNTSLISINSSVSNLSNMDTRLSGLKEILDGIEIAFDKTTQEYLEKQLGDSDTQDTEEKESTVKAENLKEVKDTWEDFKTVRSQYSKGSTQYNESLLAYQKAFNRAKSAGFITDKYDGDSSTTNDWNRAGDDFGSKESWDAATEKVENGEAIDEEGSTYINPYWEKVIVATDPQWGTRLALTSQTPGPVSMNSDAKNDANTKNVWRIADLSGKNLTLGDISSDARSWELRTKNWTDLSKIPDGIYKSGQNLDFQQQGFIIYKGNFYGLNGIHRVRLDADGYNPNQFAKVQDMTDRSIWYTINEDDWEQKKYSAAVKQHQFGIYSTSQNEQALINEVGTEAIITPNGTLTALPSHTGIVPADITKNLWALGEVAPSILRVIDNINPNSMNSLVHNTNTSKDESITIGSLNMTVNADDSFDADAFVESIKSRVALTRNTRR